MQKIVAHEIYPIDARVSICQLTTGRLSRVLILQETIFLFYCKDLLEANEEGVLFMSLLE